MNSRRPFGLFLLVFLFTVFLGGCATTSSENPHDNWLLLGSVESEKETGRQIYDQLKEKDAIYKSDTFTRYMNNIGRRLAIYSDWNQIGYRFTILRTFQVNAFALPGGYVFVTRGLLNNVEDEAELAGILAHEIAHVAARHHAKQKQLQLASLFATVAMAGAGGAGAAQGGLMAGQMTQLGYSRAHERQADRLGLEYTTRAGYDPRGLIQFLKTLRSLQDRIPDRQLLFLQTHPFLGDRIQNARMNIDSYLDRLNDTPAVNRYRFQRVRRNYLIPDDEQNVLNRFKQLLNGYEQADTSAMKALFHEKFKAKLGNKEVGTDSFLQSIAQNLDHADTINYEYQLFGLEASDTDARITYEFKITRWDQGAPYPAYTRGAQRLIWRREEDRWFLIRLR